jgi:uncharacterized protein (TIGR00730 family)
LTDIRAVTVFCGSRAGADPAYRVAAEAFGDLLARSGITLVYGGGRVGLMGAIADRVMAGGGTVVGVIPDFLMDLEVGHSGLSELVRVPNMHTRKSEMFVRSDGFVVLPGGLGTLEEAFEIITWKQLHLHAKPIVLLDTNGYWQPLVRLAQATVEGGFAHARIADLFSVVATVEEVVPALKSEALPDRIVLESHL